jgi:hypothetical protein
MSRLAKALNSSDLSHSDPEKASLQYDVEFLQACGLTAISRSLGVLIVEAKEGAAGEGSHSVARIKDLERCLAAIDPPGAVSRLARRWKVRVDVHGVAVKVTRELILDRCSVCQGRGKIPMRYDGQRMVAVSVDFENTAQDVECHVCLGSGAAKRDYHSRAKSAGFKEYTKKLGEFWEAVLNRCAEAELSARQAMWRRLKSSH